MQKGRFISFEGGEGSGKSTNIDFLAEYLRSQGIDVITTREPGGTPVSEKIRAVLLDKDNKNIHSDTELMLMFAARCQLVNELVIPSLNNGCWVIMDRHFDSSFAYQGYGRGLPLSRIEQLKEWVQGSLEPDITLLFDLPVEQGMERAGKRAELDRFEVEAMDFFERVRNGYLEIAKNNSHRVTVIDALQSIDAVGSDVIKAVSNHENLKGLLYSEEQGVMV